MCKTTRSLTHEENFVINIYKIQELLKNFLKQIVSECYDQPDDIFYKLGLEETIYKIGIHNKITKKTIIKNYELKEFLEMMSQPNKVELEMNMIVREMLIKSENNLDEKIEFI